jgi:hypothetical protein
MTDEEKLEVITEFLTDVDDGGYPGEHVWVGDTMAYTSANTGDKHGSKLGTITKTEMLDWYDRAAAWLEEHFEYDDPERMRTALYETDKE